MSSKRYTEEFKVEAVRQVTDRGHSVAEVADRLGVSIHSLYTWRKQYGRSGPERAATADQADELRRLKSELRRVTEERDILKKPRRTLPSSPGEVRLHARPRTGVPGAQRVPGVGRAPQRLLRLASRAAVGTGQGRPARTGPDQAVLAGERQRLRLSQGCPGPAGSGRALRQASCGPADARRRLAGASRLSSPPRHARGQTGRGRRQPSGAPIR